MLLCALIRMQGEQGGRQVYTPTHPAVLACVVDSIYLIAISWQL